MYHSLVLHLCPGCYARFSSHHALHAHESMSNHGRRGWHPWHVAGRMVGRLVA